MSGCCACWDLQPILLAHPYRQCPLFSCFLPLAQLGKRMSRSLTLYARRPVSVPFLSRFIALFKLHCELIGSSDPAGCTLLVPFSVRAFLSLSIVFSSVRTWRKAGFLPLGSPCSLLGVSFGETNRKDTKP